MKGGEFIYLFKYQIRDLIKIWYLPKLFLVNGSSPQNSCVLGTMLRSIYVDPIRYLKSSRSIDNPINIHNYERTDNPMEMSDD